MAGTTLAPWRYLRISIALIVAFLAFAPIAEAAATRWYATSADVPGKSACYQVDEENGGGTNGWCVLSSTAPATGSTPLNGGLPCTVPTFRAGDAASSPVHFGTSTWSWNLAHWVPSSDDWSITIGAVNSNDEFTTAATTTVDGGTLSGTLTPATPFTIPQGSWLAMRVCHTGEYYDLHIGEGKTYIEQPTGTPAYPLPEPLTLVFAALGIVAIATVAISRARKARA